MKVSAIINSINTYYGYQNQIRILRKQQIEHDAFDDEEGVKECEKKIEDIEKEIGKFLDREV